MLRSGYEVWNGWRKQNPKVIPDLSGADLIQANLSRADLTRANLRGANLGQAYLEAADIGRANLRGANLRRADLTRANLIRADLRKAHLWGADLTSTLLRDANLAESYFGETLCVAISLNGLNGLSLITHSFQSFISIDTLEMTAADLGKDATKQHEIELFLEAAGVPKEYIEFFRSRIGRPIQFYSCFISYSTKDQAFADRLYTDLRQRSIRCWLASEDLKIGDQFRLVINDAIRQHDKLVLVLSASSIESSWVEDEVKKAQKREEAEGKMVLFPVRIDGAVMETPEPWAAHIRKHRHIGDFRRWKDHDDYTKSLDRLIRDLRPEDNRKAASAPE
jgi:hypothetical protein